MFPINLYYFLTVYSETMQCASIVRTSKAMNLVLIDWNGCLLVSWRGKNWHKQIWEKSWLTFYRNRKITVQLFIQLTLEQHEFKLHGSIYATATAKSLQSCPTLCDPIDGSLPGSSVHGIFQARVLEWGAISFSNAWKWKMKMKSFSRVRLLATPWTVAYQAPPSMGFSRQEYWSGLPLPSPVNRLSPNKR